MIKVNLLVLCNIDLSQKWGDYTRVFSLMNAFAKLGNNVTIMVIRSENKKPSISRFRENSLDVIQIFPSITCFNGKRGMGRYLNYLLTFRTISKLASKIISEKKIDCVYSYMPGIGTSIPAIRISSKHKIKHLIDYADYQLYVKPKFLANYSFKKADLIITITEYLKTLLIKKGFDKNKIHLIPNGVDLSLFDSSLYTQSELKKFRTQFNSEKIIIFSGALQDLNIIIKSATKVTKRYNKVKFVIIGDHRDPTRSVKVWKNKVHEEGLDDYFEFLGRKPRDEIPKYILSADICVDSFPNEPYYAAAHPIKLLEYGACGKPVVATRVKETEKIIEHGKFGYLSNPEDPNEFADYLIELLESERKAKEMGDNFSKFIKQNFDWNKIAQDLYNVLS